MNKTWDEAIKELVEYIDTGHTRPQARAVRIISSLQEQLVKKKIAKYLWEEAENSIRRRTLKIEVASVKLPENDHPDWRVLMHKQCDERNKKYQENKNNPNLTPIEKMLNKRFHSNFYHGDGGVSWRDNMWGPNTAWREEHRKHSASSYGCHCDLCEKFIKEQDEERIERELHWHRQLSPIVEELVQERKLEWTKELLCSTFTLMDGSRVAWGEATLEQHNARVRIFTNNAAANIEGIARHQQAIDLLKKTKAPCLNKVKAKFLA